MRIHCTVRRSATRIHCTVHAINSQLRGKGGQHTCFEAIVSQAHFAICLRENFPGVNKHFVVSINVSPPAALGEGNILKCLSIT